MYNLMTLEFQYCYNADNQKEEIYLFTFRGYGDI